MTLGQGHNTSFGQSHNCVKYYPNQDKDGRNYGQRHDLNRGMDRQVDSYIQPKLSLQVAGGGGGGGEGVLNRVTA